MIIYKILNNLTGDFYIGSSIKGIKRWYAHKCLLNKNKHHSIHLQRAWNKYGKENFSFEVLQKVYDISSIYDIEQFFINNLKPKYNICQIAGKNGRLGIKHKKESIEKMRAASFGNTNRRGERHTAETILKMKNFKRIGLKIYQYSLDGIFIKEWNSGKEASLTLNIPRSSISYALNGKYKSAGSFVWLKNNNIK